MSRWNRLKWDLVQVAGCMIYAVVVFVVLMLFFHLNCEGPLPWRNE